MKWHFGHKLAMIMASLVLAASCILGYTMVYRQFSLVESQFRFPELAERFGQAMAASNLASARRLAREMAEIDPERSEDYENRLAGPIEEKAASLRARGRLLYGQGFIEEALAVWQEALQLKPDSPELIQNIHRARTFLENLNRWKEDGGETMDYGS